MSTLSTSSTASPTQGVAPRALAQDFTFLSHHAKVRLEERAILDARALIELLDGGKCVDTGRTPGYNREHLLFFSSADQECFVAIRDYHTGEVVSILTLKYHANCAWAITEEQQLQARALVEVPKAGVRAEKQQPSSFKIKLHYYNREGAIKTKTCAAASAAAYDFDPERYLASSDAVAQMSLLAKSKEVAPDEVFQLSVTLGSGTRQRRASRYFEQNFWRARHPEGSRSASALSSPASSPASD